MIGAGTGTIIAMATTMIGERMDAWSEGFEAQFGQRLDEQIFALAFGVLVASWSLSPSRT